MTAQGLDLHEMKITPQQIVHAREALGLSQTAFAAEVGVSARSVSRWENGEKLPTLPLVLQSLRRVMDTAEPQSKAKKSSAA